MFYYQEDREATLDNSTDKILMSLKAFADEMEREQGRNRTYSAMRRKAEAGHVTGGRTFGYDNMEVKDANGDGRTSFFASTRGRQSSFAYLPARAPRATG